MAQHAAFLFQRIKDSLLPHLPCTVCTKVSHGIEASGETTLTEALTKHVQETCTGLGLDRIEVLMCHNFGEWGQGKSEVSRRTHPLALFCWEFVF